MKKYIIALYKKDGLDSMPLVGIFENDLSNKPLSSFKLSANACDVVAENNVAAALRELILDSRRGTSFVLSENLGLTIKEDGQKFYFIKPEEFFNFKNMLKLLKL